MVPELFRKLRETPGKNSHQVWSKSEIACTSYAPPKKVVTLDFTHLVFLYFYRLTVRIGNFRPEIRIPREKLHIYTSGHV